MKKDGECAIVVKGTDPLFQTKCQMEKTDFVKLLCRKDKPYDPQKRRDDRLKLIKDLQKPLYIDDEARAEAKKLTEMGSRIHRITMEGQLAYFEGELLKEPQKQSLSKEARKLLSENAERYQKKKELNRDISYEEFRSCLDGTECDDAAYVRRCVVIRSLQNDGFSNHQLRCLKPLIIDEFDYDKIRQLFNPGISPEDIEKCVKQMRKKENTG